MRESSTVGACRRRRRRVGFAVGRDVEAAPRTRLGEIWKSENASLFLRRLRAPAVAHNCRQEAPTQHFFCL